MEIQNRKEINKTTKIEKMQEDIEMNKTKVTKIKVTKKEKIKDRWIKGKHRQRQQIHQ